MRLAFNFQFLFYNISANHRGDERIVTCKKLTWFQNEFFPLLS